MLTQRKKEASFKGLVLFCLGEVAAVHLCMSNDLVFKQFISEFQTELTKISRELLSSMLKGIHMNPMNPIDHQQWSAFEKLSNTEVNNDMHIIAVLVS